MSENPQLDQETRSRILREVAAECSLLIDPQIKLQASLFDKAKTYSNVVLAVGYAGYFGVWSYTKPFLSRRQSIWTAILLLASLTTYVLFEVLVMFVTSRSMRYKANELFKIDPATTDPWDLPGRFAAFETEGNRALLRFAPMWSTVYVVAVGTGLGGVLVMLSGLFWQLTH